MTAYLRGPRPPVRTGCRVLGAALALAALGRPALADDTSIRVDCPVLPDEVRAEFEARVRVDLSLRAQVGGELKVTCDGTNAAVSWHLRSSGTFARSIPARAEPSALVDTLLVVVAELVSEGTRVRPTDAERADSSGDEGDEPAARVSIPRPHAARDEATGSAERSSHNAFSLPPLGVSVGGMLQVFGTTPPGVAGAQGILGADAALLVGLPEGFVLGLGAEYGVGFGEERSEVSVQVLGARLQLARWMGSRRAFELALGATAGQVFVSAQSPITPATASKGYAGFTATGRYAFEMAAVRVAVGPEVRFYLAPVRVSLDGLPVYDVPYLFAGLTVDVSTRLFGSLW